MSDAGEDAVPEGDPACWLPRVCHNCGKLAAEEKPTICAHCGATEFGD